MKEVDDVKAGGLWAGFWEGGEGEFTDLFAVFWVVSDQDLDKEHTNKVVLVTRLVNWDARVASRKNVVHSLFVKDGVGGHGEDVLHWGHDVSDWLVLEVKHGGNDSHLILVQAIRWAGSEGLVKSDERLETRLLVDGSVILAEKVVEELGGWPCNWSE